jgi:photosystem II stability/assembly factor-like uncharacterized protein
MKKTLVQFFCFLCPVLAFSQWTWQNPLPQGNRLNSAYFTDANTGYLVGESGTIIKTYDGGQTWITLNTDNPDIKSLSKEINMIIGSE